MKTTYRYSGAHISQCGRYRYRLTRCWDDTLPHVTFVMLNPSTADADQDDPTIRRCVGFARSLRGGGLTVVSRIPHHARAIRAHTTGEHRMTSGTFRHPRCRHPTGRATR